MMMRLTQCKLNAYPM